MVSYNAVPYNQKPFTNRCCKTCHNASPAGEPIPPHAYGYPVCPEVQNGTVVCRTLWKGELKHAKCPRIRWYGKEHKREGRPKGGTATRTTTRTTRPDGAVKAKLR